MVFGALKSAFERGYFVTRRGAHIHHYIETAIHFASLKLAQYELEWYKLAFVPCIGYIPKNTDVPKAPQNYGERF